MPRLLRLFLALLFAGGVASAAACGDPNAAVPIDQPGITQYPGSPPSAGPAEAGDD